jgi:hypothetical protein
MRDLTFDEFAQIAGGTPTGCELSDLATAAVEGGIAGAIAGAFSGPGILASAGIGLLAGYTAKGLTCVAKSILDRF